MRTGWLGGLSLALLAACAPAPPPTDTGTGPVAPGGFGPATVVTLEPGVYPVATSAGSAEPDLVVEGGDFPVRRVAADRVRVGFSTMISMAPDGTQVVAPAPPVFETRATVRVGGTDLLERRAQKRVAVMAALSFCGLPAPTAEDLYLWGDEVVMQAADTGEWQFVDMC